MITIELHSGYVSNLIEESIREIRQKVIDRYVSRNSELYEVFGNFSRFRCFRILMQRIENLVFELNTPLRKFFFEWDLENTNQAHSYWEMGEWLWRKKQVNSTVWSVWNISLHMLGRKSMIVQFISSTHLDSFWKTILERTIDKTSTLSGDSFVKASL